MMMTPTFVVDLTNCDREPIHVPGSTQSHGVLVACDESWTITHAAVGRLPQAPDLRAATLLGSSVAGLLGEPVFEELRGRVNTTGADASIVPARVFSADLPGWTGPVHVSAHLYDGRRIVEIEPTDTATASAPLDLVRAVLARLQRTQNLRDLADQTARELRDLIGFDRVMIYRFHEDGTGQVIAEARHHSLTSLLEHRFPSTDVPRQARELYKKNWVRLIHDVKAPPVPILAVPGEERPLDLSFADLRSVSPIHIEYLRNMGVGASMSISILVAGELWGLIACHHMTERLVFANVRAAAELLGQVFSLQIQTVESIEAYVTMRAGRLLLDRVISELPIGGNLVNDLAARLDQFAAFLPCDGVAVFVDGAYRVSGTAPNQADAGRLVRLLEERPTAGVYATNRLEAELDPGLPWTAPVAGVLAVPLSREPGSWLLFFRKPVTQTIAWGGDPRKLPAADGSGRLSPRKSFELWKEEVRGQSIPWTSRERLVGDTLRVYLLDIILRFGEVIRHERLKAEQKQRLLTNELNHRVRGMLELIQSLVMHGYEEPGRVKEFVRALEGRIKAIALAHDATSVQAGSDVRTLVDRALALESTNPQSIDVHGPDVKLDAKSYTVLALVVHELVSDAARTGALASAAARLTVSWFLDAEGRLVVLWDETNVIPRTPADNALGVAIIKRNIPHALGGEAELTVSDTVVRASFVIPARHVVEAASLPGPSRAAPQLTVAPRPLANYGILVVEDQMPAALELERVLLDRGAASVRVVGTVAAALAAIALEPPDVALLDMDLGDEDCLDVADELTRRTTPFLFAATAADREFIPPRYEDVPVVPKPYQADTVVDLIKEAMLSRLIRAVLTQLV